MEIPRFKDATFGCVFEWPERVAKTFWQPRDRKCFERLRTDIIAVLSLRLSSDRSSSKIAFHMTFVDFSIDM
jgi:hypothetical protein